MREPRTWHCGGSLASTPATSLGGLPAAAPPAAAPLAAAFPAGAAATRHSSGASCACSACADACCALSVLAPAAPGLAARPKLTRWHACM